MHVKKILGGVTLESRHHAIAKLTGGGYAVGHLTPGAPVGQNQQFADLDSAFAHWHQRLDALIAPRHVN